MRLIIVLSECTHRYLLLLVLYGLVTHFQQVLHLICGALRLAKTLVKEKTVEHINVYMIAVGV